MTRSKDKTYIYNVWGHNGFPEDMLRYDRAEIVSIEHDGLDRTKYYVLKGKNPPTVGRWNSFLWAVGDVKEIKG